MDGGVNFSVSLVNNVVRPAKQIKSSLLDVKRSFLDTQKAMAAPAPRRSGISDWSKMTAAARRSQARDQVAQLTRISRLNAADATRRQREAARASKMQLASATKDAKKLADSQKKEAKRVEAYKTGMAQQKLDRQGGLVDFASSTLGYGAAGIAAGAVAAAAGVAYLGYKFAETSVQAATFGQDSKLALTLLTGSSKVAALEFDNVRHEAAELGLGVQDTVLGFQKLLAAQFEVGKAKELIRMSADLQAIGASADQTKRAIVAISQIKNTGYLQGDELNQLREAGVSTELVYEALGKRLGKTTQQIISMQEKRQLGSEDVIESILQAVRVKTGVENTGDAGRKFARENVRGQWNKLQGDVDNLFLDIGEAILPGLMKMTAKVSSLAVKLFADPRIAQLGDFMLQRFETFVNWTESNWPKISDTLTTGVHLMAESIEFVVKVFDTGTIQGKAFAGVLLTLGVVMGIVTIAGVMLTIGLWLIVAAIGLVVYGIYKAVMWVVDAISSLTSLVPAGSTNSTVSTSASDNWMRAIPGLTSTTTGAPAGASITTAAESATGARLPAMLAGVGQESITVQGEQQSPNGPSKTINMNGWQVGTGIDEAALLSKVRSTVKKELEES